MVGRSLVDCWKFDDAEAVGVLERIDRLIVVPDNGEMTARGELDREFLLGLIEVLIFVDQDVTIRPALRCGRIVAQVTVGKGH
jgi:hypothetical protein